MTRLCLAALVLAAAVLGLGARPASPASDACPTSNPPNELVIAGGSSQTTTTRRLSNSELVEDGAIGKKRHDKRTRKPLVFPCQTASG